jgi:ABC-2 type transport system ATP-binding protein
VLAVGDRAFREKCLKRIDELLDNGQTLFYVSHSEASLKRFCQRGLYLAGGELRADGPINEVIDQFVADTGGRPSADDDDGAMELDFATAGGDESYGE